MPPEKAARFKISVVLRLFIVIFFALLVASIIYPNRQKKRQNQEMQLCHQRLISLDHVAQEFHKKNNCYASNLRECLESIESDTAEFAALHQDSLLLEPITREPYQIQVNTRLVNEGVVLFRVAPEQADSSILYDLSLVTFFSHFLQHEPFPSDSTMAIPDSLPQAQEDSLVSLRLNRRLAQLQPGQLYAYIQRDTLTISADSLTAWCNIVRRLRGRILTACTDSLDRAFLADGAFLALAMRVSCTEFYRTARVDTVGVTVVCPMDSLYLPPDQPFLRKIFGAGFSRNHGRIENGNYSWKEKE